MDLHHKVILITGGSKRIGRTLVETFVQAGARVAFTYRKSQKEAQQVVKKHRHQNASIQAFHAELGNLEDVKKILKSIKKDWGGVDILINSASDFYATPLSKISETDWDHFMKVNLKGPSFFAWQAGMEMKKKGCGKIINIADWAAERPYKNYLPYCVAKSGILGLTRGLALELAPEVTVNAISPGPVLPPDHVSQSQKQALAQTVPLKRLGSPQNIAEAALYLARYADYTTGSILYVDGGRLLV